MNIIELESWEDGFIDFRWVSVARSTAMDRLILNSIHIEVDPEDESKMCIVATNGKRIHMARRKTNFATGNYLVVKSTEKEFLAVESDLDGLHYPSFRQIFPDYKPEDLREIHIPPEENSELRRFLIATNFHDLQKAHFNLSFLCEAAEGLSSLYIFQRDETEPILVQDCPGKYSRIAMVMPCRKD